MLEKADPPAERPTERENLDRWRAAQLARLGFDEHAVELLVAVEADLHDVARLLNNGCPHATALLILI